MKKEKLVKISKELVSDGKTPIQNLRRNLSIYISSPDITLKDISDGADISFDTLKNLIYQNTRDCKLSTVYSLFCALLILQNFWVYADLSCCQENKENISSKSDSYTGLPLSDLRKTLSNKCPEIPSLSWPQLHGK